MPAVTVKTNAAEVIFLATENKRQNGESFREDFIFGERRPIFIPPRGEDREFPADATCVVSCQGIVSSRWRG